MFPLPKGAHVLISFHVITLYGKRNWADVIKLGALRWGGYFGLSGWVHCNHNCPYKREIDRSVSEKEIYPEVRGERERGFKDG